MSERIRKTFAQRIEEQTFRQVEEVEVKWDGDKVAKKMMADQKEASRKVKELLSGGIKNKFHKYDDESSGQTADMNGTGMSLASKRSVRDTTGIASYVMSSQKKENEIDIYDLGDRAT